MTTPNYKYDWGETVRVITTAPETQRPNTLCSVCGMRNAEGLLLYLVEFGDGESVEIEEDKLEVVRE
jgi:hypothetical protein